ncbi:class I adenylate-forming enzyme family protein [Roseibium aggregatum]|uniref:AMP-binding protein n=1 Tax=Roseibium aggregatum TaxID=187304 RepID=A0A926P374_9HYPH|nr:AMP-binding protein [Roseibium aggregatum]MBD1549346.1 AMP-binding protein [Roseibium aggregatum]
MLDHIGQIPANAAQRFANREALIAGGRRFTFAELNGLIEAVAGGLSRLGLGQGDIVTLYAANSWEWIVSYFAVARLGAVINPVNTMLTPAEVEYVVKDCGAKAIIASPDKIAGILGVTEVSSVQSIIAIGDAPVAGAISFDGLIAARHPAPPPPDVAADSLGSIAYTSGTTGQPKGAMQSHRAVILNGAMTSQMHMRGADDIVVSALPCPHVYANVLMTGMMMCGTKLVLHERFDSAAVLADIERHSATIFDGVPAMYMYILNNPDLKQSDLSSLRRCYVGGQTMPVTVMEAVEAAFGAPLIELWGMTEIAGLGATHPLLGRNKHGSIGCAMPYCELRIADAENAGRTMPRGEVGELMVRGPIVMMGYFGDPEKTRETLEPDGWMHTGDLGTMDVDNCVNIVDRKKDMILTGGYNVYPAEIERALAAHPAVALSAVGKLPDAVKGEIAKAYVVLKEGAACTEDEIIAFCRETLAAYKCPRTVQFVKDVPKTSTGKIMRRELYKLDQG